MNAVMLDLPPAEIRCISAAMYHESRGESEIGQRAVAHVILNRAKKYDKTPCQVIRQPGQFNFRMQRSYSGPIWEKLLKLARNLGSSPVGQALYFNTDGVQRRAPFRLIRAIGRHLFYK